MTAIDAHAASGAAPAGAVASATVTAFAGAVAFAAVTALTGAVVALAAGLCRGGLTHGISEVDVLRGGGQVRTNTADYTSTRAPRAHDHETQGRGQANALGSGTQIHLHVCFPSVAGTVGR